jgi:phage terminase large subunit-like protein
MEPAAARAQRPPFDVAEPSRGDCFSAEEPDRLRGPTLDGAWLDELAACPLAEPVLANLQMCLRIAGPKGDALRLVAQRRDN